jgi:hypothetical protein
VDSGSWDETYLEESSQGRRETGVDRIPEPSENRDVTDIPGYTNDNNSYDAWSASGVCENRPEEMYPVIPFGSFAGYGQDGKLFVVIGVRSEISGNREYEPSLEWAEYASEALDMAVSGYISSEPDRSPETVTPQELYNLARETSEVGTPDYRLASGDEKARVEHV